MMKNILLLFALHLVNTTFLQGQHIQPSDKQRKDIQSLIDKYSEAREKSDTLLLKSILTPDIDQLVSTGEWRNGIDASMKGMQRSSANNAGTRTLTIERIRLLNLSSAIVDCKYEIKNPGGTVRKMWSTFIIVSEKGVWKISAIRNMLPAGNP
jgi:ketosteroid isomerase-like protein